MASKDLTTKIILKGMTDPSLKKAFQNANNLANNHLNVLKKAGETAKKIAKAGTVAVAAGLGASVKAAIDYESAFAGVMKTVNETSTTTYDDLSNSIRKLSTELPASATEIAGVAEVAGQLGIKADDIMTFTKTMINLGETTNIVAEDAASTIAKYFNITNTGMKDVDKFGATLVALGNNAATTENDIMNMASRIAASGSMIGLSNQEILALATSLSSVGLEAEGGGTAISTVLSQIDKQVAMNGEQLKTWASLAGMSASEFKTAWADDTMGTIQKVVTGMGDAKAGGENLNLILDDLGIKGIRTSDTMKRLTNASGLLNDMTNLANTAWDENSALTKEAGTRYGTMASKIQILKNKLTNVAITIGNSLMPVVEAITKKIDQIDWEGVGESIVNVIKWISDHSTLLLTIISAVAAAFVAFKVVTFVQGIITAITVIKTIITTFGLLNTVMMMNPIALIVAGIAALIAIFVVLWKKCEGFRNFWIGLWESVVGFFKKNWKSLLLMLVNPFAGVFKLLYDNCEGFRNFWTKLWDKLKSAFVNTWNAIKNFFVVTIPNAFKSVLNFFKENWKQILLFIINPFAGAAALLYKYSEKFRGFVNKIANFFKELPYKIGYFIGSVVGTLWKFVTVTVPQFINNVINWFKQLPSRIWTWLVNTAKKITAWGINIKNKMVSAATSAITATVNWFKQLPSRTWTWLVNTVKKIATWAVNVKNKMASAAKNAITAVINWFKQLPSKIWTWLSNAAQKVVSWGASLVAKGKKAATDFFNAIVNKIKGLPAKMLEIGKDIIKGIWNGIKNAKDWLLGKIKGFASGIVDGFKNALGINSPSVVMEKLFKWVPVGAGNGILDNAKYAVRAVKSMGGKITNAASKIKPFIQTKVATVSDKLKKFGTGGTVTRPQHAIVGDKPETIVPHGNTARNRALLHEAAKGVGKSTGGSVYSFTFAPVIHGGNATENKRMLEEEYIKFKQMMDEYIREKGALAY